jgi:hypothetical protein
MTSVSTSQRVLRCDRMYLVRPVTAEHLPEKDIRMAAQAKKREVLAKKLCITPPRPITRR